MDHRRSLIISFPAFRIILLASLAFAGCNRPEQVAPKDKISVVATTNIVAEFVQLVGGEKIELATLIPPDADPHTFEPRPQDIAAISESQIVFVNGLGLEESLAPILDANALGKLVEVSATIEGLKLGQPDPEHPEDDHSGWDPHTWMDPINVIAWVDVIDQSLSEFDPANRDYYHQNAAAAKVTLQDLDKWIVDQVSQIPPERRLLVSDHAVFGYFAQRYNFIVVGMVIHSFSTNASISAQDLSVLQQKILEEGALAVFVSHASNPKIAEQLANDLGIKVVQIYSGSLGQPGGEADTYEKYMHYNVTQIVNALK